MSFQALSLKAPKNWATSSPRRAEDWAAAGGEAEEDSVTGITRCGFFSSYVEIEVKEVLRKHRELCEGLESMTITSIWHLDDRWLRDIYLLVFSGGCETGILNSSQKISNTC